MVTATLKQIFTKYRITPLDIRNYFIVDDLTHSEQRFVLKDLFEHHCNQLAWDVQKNFHTFRTKVEHEMILYELKDEELDEVNLILSEVSRHELTESKQSEDIIACYFKLIWLQLMYSGISYRKIKLRNLLHDFGYKRRTAALTNHMNLALNALGLKTYLRGHEECDICDAGLDDMIMIRLAVK